MTHTTLLSHLDADGVARMVDISSKSETYRTATAEALVLLDEATRDLVRLNALPKGDVVTVAKIAGVLAAKRVPELIPLCHSLPLTDTQITIVPTDDGLQITATASCVGRTGVEMEAMTAASIAALTIYDMCKSSDKGIEIRYIRLLEKSGGKSGDWRRPEISETEDES